ncbi:HD-GYP domain-containing protein [Fuchsiella alkaliacetigena]|uniref:HD-GYP domain-containing protein n=1 Tax=Fuchsiella alkaliacetigena TaxID=957042 RepID=UPI00200B59A9|nr:HD-GYP domain-containing protein [Fuchsiella alkaliacetigena]MCK8824044.1 HD-GYP domain-containing protein [Fuchsiella alkaliacetigena]
MYLTKISDLESGDTLAKKIYTSDNEVLLEKGTELNSRYIKKLESFGITHVYIEDENLVEVEDVVCEEVKQVAVSTAKECLQGLDSLTIDREVTNDKKKKGLIDPQEITDLIEDIIDNIFNKPELFVNLRDVRKLDDELYFHLTNVTTLSLIVGKVLGYDKEKLKSLGIGAFLHDIGKAAVEASILNKAGELTDGEFAEIQKHTVYGYQILKDIDQISEASALVAYQHHEKCDGSGYPQGLTKDQIGVFSRIVTIADIFDAMQNNRVYRIGLKTKEIIDYLLSMASKQELDAEIVDKFLAYLVPFPVGCKVRLGNGCEGVVTKINKDNVNRPVIKVLKINKRELEEYFEIDTSEELTGYEIEELL